MVQRPIRRFLKDVLSFTKVKLLHTRITLSRYTSAFFWVAVFNFILGVAFQAVTLNDHVVADHVTTALLSKANIQTSTFLPLLIGDDQILICDGIPGMEGTRCDFILPLGNSPNQVEIEVRDGAAFERDLAIRDSNLFPCPSLAKRAGEQIMEGEANISTGSGGILVSVPCITSFIWLAEMLRDAKREDIITLTFEVWLLVLAIITILNESLPHLVTVFIGHVLLTGWAAFRIHESRRLRSIYYDGIVDGPCQGYDPMGEWWTQRIQHSIPIVTLNAIALLAVGYLSFKLYKVYATQTFSRVGASPTVHKVYKIVLLLSVAVQLTGFFALASTGIWIDKIAYGPVRQFVTHFPFYLAAFIILAVVAIPSLVLGWISVRRESSRTFPLFIGLTVLELAIFVSTFASPIYRFVFNRWAFFATLTVTSFVLMCATFALGLWCRQGFGKGLKQYLRVMDTLEGADFTPVVFSVSDEKKGPLILADPSIEREKGHLDLTFPIEHRPSFIRVPSTKKSSLFLPTPSLYLNSPPDRRAAAPRPESHVFGDGAPTKMVSPTPALVREQQRGNLVASLVRVEPKRPSIKPAQPSSSSQPFPSQPFDGNKVVQIGMLKRTSISAASVSTTDSVRFAMPATPPPTRTKRSNTDAPLNRPSPVLRRIASGSALSNTPNVEVARRQDGSVGLPAHPSVSRSPPRVHPVPQQDSSQSPPGFF